MRIMADANIIVSAILFPKSVIANALKHLIDNYSLVLSKYTIIEYEINRYEKSKYLKPTPISYKLKTWKLKV